MTVFALDASNHDRAWFERNPTRRYRLRRPLSGETEQLQFTAPPGATAVVCVEQIAPGVRCRKPVALTGWPDPKLRECDLWIEFVLRLARGETA